MTGATDLETRYRACRDALERRGQGHVLRWWDGLTPHEREQLLADLESVPWNTVDPLIGTHVLSKTPLAETGRLEPPPVYPKDPRPDLASLYVQAARVGREQLEAGKVGVMTVAGGQGTRLGISGPKGKVIVTPVGHCSLFQLFAEMVLAASRRYGAAVPWFIMTSPANHDETVEYFESNSFFGLSREDILFFPQGQLPLFDFSGRLLLDQKHRLSLGPDGHGGALAALRRSGALDEMRRRGVQTLSYFQVDNPLVKPFDPFFIGLHVLTGSQMSTKVARKVDDHERVGNVCLQDGRLTVIEYSDFPKSYSTAKSPDGTRRFDAGNLAIHLFDLGFVRQVTDSALSLPYRRAEKAVPYVDEKGVCVELKSPNAVKLETFIFDVLPLAKNPLVLEVDRAEEFSPVKNAAGPDSLETSQRDQVRRACRWLESVGVTIPRRPDGEPDITVAMSPLFASDPAELNSRISDVPDLKPGQSLSLA